MGGASFWAQQARERTLGTIVNENYRCIVMIEGTRTEEGKEVPVRGGYHLFEDPDRTEEIMDYAKRESARNDVRVLKVHIFSLDCKPYKTLEIPEITEQLHGTKG